MVCATVVVISTLNLIFYIHNTKVKRPPPPGPSHWRLLYSSPFPLVLCEFRIYIAKFKKSAGEMAQAPKY